MFRSRVALARQLAFALWLFVLLTSQLAAMGHLVFVRHSLCEHGAAVHGGDHQDALEQAPSTRTSASGAALDQGERSEASHEHCDPSGIMPALAQADPYCLTPTLLDAYLLPWSLRPQRASASVSVLDLAPKNSPPA